MSERERATEIIYLMTSRLVHTGGHNEAGACCSDSFVCATTYCKEFRSLYFRLIFVYFISS